MLRSAATLRTGTRVDPAETEAVVHVDIAGEQTRVSPHDDPRSGGGGARVVHHSSSPAAAVLLHDPRLVATPVTLGLSAPARSGMDRATLAVRASPAAAGSNDPRLRALQTSRAAGSAAGSAAPVRTAGVEGGRRLLACSGYTACVAAATCTITTWTSVATISITLGLQSNGGYPNAGTLITGSMTASYSGSGASITASSSVSSGTASFHCTNGGYDCCWTWTSGSITCLAGWVCAGAPINDPPQVIATHTAVAAGRTAPG